MENIIEHVSKHGIDAVVKTLSLKLKVYTVNETEKLYVLNYNQIKTPKSNLIAQQCRGIIIHKDKLNGLRVVCRPFNRFFNLGEEGKNVFKFDSGTKVYEKADGSLIKIYFFGERWEIATRGSAFGENPNGKHSTFRQQVIGSFHMSSEEEFQQMMQHMDKNVTFTLEYTSPENKIVTTYEKPEMVFIGARNTETGDDVYHTYQEFPNSRLPKTFPVKSIDDCLRLISSLREDEEGFVLTNSHGDMVKIKSPRYLALIGGGGRNKKKSPTQLMAEAVVDGEEGEFMAVYPDHASKTIQLKEALSTKLSALRQIANPTTDLGKGSLIKEIWYKAHRNNITIQEAFDMSSRKYKIKVVNWIINSFLPGP